jgi:hypothetical protein
MALKLDLSLIKLGLQNTSLSSHDPMSPDSDLPSRLEATTPPSAQHGPRVVEPDTCSEIDIFSTRSIVSLGSCPSTAPTLSDLPLTPIPELLRTPTKHTTPFTDVATLPEPPFTHMTANPSHEKRRHLRSRLPAPLDNGPIIGQLLRSQNDVNKILVVRILQRSKAHITDWSPSLSPIPSPHRRSAISLTNGKTL